MAKTKLEDTLSEQHILSAMLAHTDNIDKALLTVNPDYFSVPSYKTIFKVVGHVYAKHGSIVTNELFSKYLESFGVPQDKRLKFLKVLDELKLMKLTNAEFSYALSSVKKAFIAKSVALALAGATKKLEEKGGVEAFTFLENKLYDMKVNLTSSDNLVVVDARNVDDFVERLDDIRLNPDKYKGMPTGWITIDTRTGGFQKGEYVLVIAPPGGGKSLTLLNWANNFQKEGYNVAYVSLEMPHWEIRLRQLSLESGIPYLDLKLQNLNDKQIKLQDYTLKSVIASRKAAFYVVDMPFASVGFIEAQIRQLSKTIPLDAVFIDYLKLIKTDTPIKGKKEWEILAQHSEELRSMARSLNIMVASAHQVNASGMNKTIDEELNLSDIAGCKAIADPAHAVVGMIWDKCKPHEMKACVPKARGGRIDSAMLHADLDRCRITDASNEIDISSDVHLDV